MLSSKVKDKIRTERNKTIDIIYVTRKGSSSCLGSKSRLITMLLVRYIIVYMDILYLKSSTGHLIRFYQVEVLR